MPLTNQITFAVAVNDRKVLEENLLASPCLRSPHRHQILLQEHFPSASMAYNDAIRKATNDIIIFLHQDMFLPEMWLSQLEEQLSYLEETARHWGVLGCWGAKADGGCCGHIYSSGLGVLGGDFKEPIPVQTLDEIVLIVRKSTGLLFDERLPKFHFYGTDICLRSAMLGLTCYAISAFCVHNTRQLLQLPKDFYDCYAHLKRVWKDHLPIQTTCIRISRFDAEMYRRRIKDSCRPSFMDKRHSAVRIADPTEILRMLA